jgi:predicted aspartyl protease
MARFQSQLEERCTETVSSIMVNGPSAAYIPLLKYETMYKVKVTLGSSSSKYYVMDSGAAMSLISKSYAKELEKMNVITKKSYVGEEIFGTASGERVSCKIVIINNVQIGDFSLDNVKFAVMNEDIVFLLGKNVLNAFQSWHINNNNATLELVK